MKSFRLDPASVGGFFSSLPVLVAGVAVVAGVRCVAGPELFRLVLLLVGALASARVLRGGLRARLERKYPGAQWIGLLAFGLSTLYIGFGLDLILGRPELMVVWVPVSFVCLLVFVLRNRRNPSVME